jgi:hypothetical protein
VEEKGVETEATRSGGRMWSFPEKRKRGGERGEGRGRYWGLESPWMRSGEIVLYWVWVHSGTGGITECFPVGLRITGEKAGERDETGEREGEKGEEIERDRERARARAFF